MPTVFFGCYNKSDIKNITQHSGKKILIWGGSDTLQDQTLKKIKHIKNIIHVAQSDYITKDLAKHKIKSIYIPVAPTVSYTYFKPVIKGPCIYIYTNPVDENFYGKCHYKNIMNSFPNIKFYIACSPGAFKRAKKKKIKCVGINTYTRSELLNIYSKCFIALRLTHHDGISAGVQEMGLMGIKTIHNGITPSCLRYKTLSNIKQHIQNEMQTIGTTDTQLASDVENFLKKGDQKLLSLF